MESSEKFGFGYDGSSVIFDNSDNAHMCSEEDMIEPIISNGVANIGGKGLFPKGIGTVIWSWNNNEVQLHTKTLNNVLYFPDSPVYILSTTTLA